MRAGRLLNILILLQLRGRMSAEALAREFEVSVRTIYRDVDHLSAAGVPVYAERGRDGGFALHEGYRTRLTGLTPAEAEALMLAGVGGAAADLGMGAAAAAAQLKMLASLPPESGATAQRIGARFHLDPLTWYARTEPVPHLRALAEAVWRDRRIRVRYTSWTANVDRTLDPLGLVLKGGAWYLVAAARGQPRTYRVSSIDTLDVLDGPSRRPSRFNLARYWTAWAADFESRLLSDRATVRISPAGLALLRDVSAAAAEAVQRTGRPCTPAGWLRAQMPVETVTRATRQILRLGAEVEILAPTPLRDAVAAEARRVAQLYGRRRRVSGSRPD